MPFNPNFFNVKDFGAIGDGAHDDFGAFQSALDAMAALTGRPPGERASMLFVPTGRYRLSRTLHIDRTMTIQGANGLHGSQLVFNLDIPGIIVDMEKEPPPASGWRALAPGTIIRDISVTTGYNYGSSTGQPPDPPAGHTELQFQHDPVIAPTKSGIVLYARARIDNCYISGFQHDGIHINTSAGLGRNANHWQIQNCFVQLNGRHGLFVSGGEANAGCAIGLLIQTNGRWGVYERSFLGNTYVACATEANGHMRGGAHVGGGFRTATNANHVLLGCYSEKDQIENLLHYQTLVLGGNHGAALRLDRVAIPELAGDHLGSYRNLAFVTSDGRVEMNNIRVYGPIATAVRLIAHDAVGSPHKIDPEDSIIFANTSAIPSPAHPLILLLPRLPDPHIAGRQYTFKRVDAGINPVSIRVAPDSTGSIDGAPTLDLERQYQWVVIVSDGTNWNIIGRG